MKHIKTDFDIEMVKKKLLIVENETSSFALVENGKEGYDSHINIFFDPTNLDEAKLLLSKSGYYSNNNTHLLGKKDEDLHLINLGEITYIEGINNDTYIHTSTDEYLVKEKLYELETKLFDKKFVRISKSYIVSINKISRIKSTFNGKLLLVLNGKTNLEVSRHYLQNFKQFLGM